ncbi:MULTISPECIES: hypothetical protein [unclassified Lysobacter]
MRSTISLSQAAVAGILLVGLAAGSGCSWFSKTDELYAQQTRPLEVPPDLDLPRTGAAVDMPVGSATASDTVAAAAASPGSTAAPAQTGSVGAGFVVPGSRDEVFAQVDAALAEVDGVTVASRAKLLGAFDVNYRDSNFLVRVSETEAGAYVSAVDPRGMPAVDEAPVALITALKAALGGQ